MNHNEITTTLHHIRPNAKWSVRELDIEWLDENQKQPSEEELQAGWLDYQNKMNVEKEQKNAKRQEALMKLQTLGLNEDDLKALNFSF